MAHESLDDVIDETLVRLYDMLRSGAIDKYGDDFQRKLVEAQELLLESKRCLAAAVGKMEDARAIAAKVNVTKEQK